MDIGRLTAIFDADTRKFDAGAKSVQKSIKDMESAAAKGAKTISGFTAGVAGGITAVFGIGLANEVRRGVGALVSYSSQLESTKIAFTTLLGSAEAATSHLKELQEFARTTPFQFPDLIAASQRMQALGIEAQKVVPLLNDIGNAVAAAGGGSERLDRVTLALAQIESKGHVAAQEINQLAEAGISGMKILEKSTGKAGDELSDLIKKGKISSEQFTAAFQKFSKENYGTLMQQQSKTFLGAISNIQDSVFELADKALRPTFNMLSEKLQAVGDDLNNNEAKWRGWADTIALQIERVIGGVEMVGHALEGLGILIDNAISKLGAIPLLGTVGTLISSVSGSGGGNQGFRDTGFNPFNPNSPLVGPLDGPRLQQNVFNRIAPTINRITGGGGRRRRTGSTDTDTSGGGGGRGRKQKPDDILTIQEVAQEWLTLQEEARTDLVQLRPLKEILQDIIATPAKSIQAIIDLADAAIEGFERAGNVLTRGKTATEQLDELIDKGPPSAKPLEKQVEARERIRQVSADLADNLTSIFADSIARGFEQGAKRGLVSLAQGLLQIVEQVFLRRLAEGLSNVLFSAGTTSGGGFGSSILRAVLGGVLGGAVGPSLGSLAGSFLGKGVTGAVSTTTTPLLTGLITRASGGPVSAGMPYLVGERGPEMFIPGSSGSIAPNGAGTIININVPVARGSTYSSPKSRRELAQQIAGALQGAL